MARITLSHFYVVENICDKSNTVEQKAEEMNKLLRLNTVTAQRVGVHWPKPPRPLEHYNHPNKDTIYQNIFNVAPKLNRGLKINFIETDNTDNHSNKIKVHHNIFSEWPEPIPVENTTKHLKMEEPIYENICNVVPPKVNREWKRNFVETKKEEPIYQNISSLVPNVDRTLKLKLVPVTQHIEDSLDNDFLRRNNLPRAPTPPSPPTQCTEVCSNNDLRRNNLPEARKLPAWQRTGLSTIYENEECQEKRTDEGVIPKLIF